MAETQQQVLTVTASKDWSSQEWHTWFIKRLQSMRTKREPFDVAWDLYEKQNKAESFYDNDWVLNVNVPLEKTLKEIYMGRTEWKIPFDIIPDWQANVEELQPAKYALNYFLDWNEKDNFWKENRNLRDNKATYGSGIFFTGIRNYKDFRYEVKKDAEITNTSDVLNESNFNEVLHETWFFFPESIHPKDFYIDDAAYWQNDVQQAQDCIRKQKLSRFDFEIQYGDNEAFKNVKEVIAWIDLKPKNENDQSVDFEEIILYHYYHKSTKKYIINANETTDIYEWRYLYNDGKLPFENIQHYTREDRFWGEGIPERSGWIKAYKSEVWQDILAWASMSSWINLLTGNDDQIWQDWSIWGRGLNVWRTAWGAESVKQVSTSVDLRYFTAVLDMLDKQTAVDTWINPLDQFDPGSDKVGIVEIMEANKSVRNRSVDENYNIWLDWALTMMFSRVKQFAPALLMKKIKTEDGSATLKVEFPKIRIENHEVVKEAGKQVFVESMWKYGYFELKPGVIQGLWVKITTPSTNSMLPILERQKIADYMTNMTNLWNIAALDQTGEMMTTLKESINMWELIGWINDAYSYDSNSLKANSEKDKINKKITERMDILKKALTTNPTPDATQDLWIPPGPTATPQLPPTWGQEAWQAMWWVLWEVSGSLGWATNQGPAAPLI